MDKFTFVRTQNPVYSKKKSFRFWALIVLQSLLPGPTLDWIEIEQGLTSDSTHFRSFQRRDLLWSLDNKERRQM